MTLVKTPLSSNHHLPFLAGGGEMGELTRTYDWSKTAVGTPDQWPQSLRTTLGILLHSAFPMFLFWGADLVCFYNDAFRPSLGIEGKHPAIGKKGREVWAEIWAFIGPLIEKVMTTGEPVWFEDQLVPFYRNGKIEDIYWTFSYSPAYGDNGEINGVFVTCTETTKAVNTLQQLEESGSLLRSMVEQAPVAITSTRGEAVVIESINSPMLQIMGKKSKEEVLGKPMIEVLPEVANQPVLGIVKNVLFTGQAYNGSEVPVSLRVDGQLKEHFFDLSYTPVTVKGKITSVLHIAIDVTEKVLNRKHLEESERRFRTIVHQAPVAIAIFRGPQFIIELANEEHLQLWGRRAEQVLGLPLFDALPEVKGQGYEELLQEVMVTGKPFYARELSAPLVRKGKQETVYFDFVYQPLTEANGHITGVVVVANEITKQVEARQAIEESEAKLRSLVESAPFPIGVYVGREMRIQLANQSIMDIWAKGNDVVGKLYRDILPELQNQAIFNQLDGVYTTGIPFHAHHQRVDLVVDGKLQPYYFNYSFTPLYDTQGNIYGVMNTAAEVTDLVLAQKKIAESEQNLRNIILQAPVAMCLLRGSGHVIEIANERMFQIWGLPSEEMLQKPLFEALPEGINQTYAAHLQMVFTTGETFAALSVPATVVREGIKETIYTDLVYQAQRANDGTISGIIAVHTDVTGQVLARKALEESQQAAYQWAQELAVANEEIAASNEDLGRANAQLVRINNELDTFIYTASHDLKSPILNIEGLLKALERELKKEHPQSGHIEQLNSFLLESVGRFKATIRDLTDVARISKESTEDIEHISLAAMLEEVVLDLAMPIREAQARLETDLDGEQVRFSRKNLKSILYNLLSNAIKYRSEDRELLIRITCQPQENYLVLSVADNGLGMDLLQEEKIFALFKRLHTHVEGTGIGLYMVKKMLENAGGKIQVESQVGVGSTFKVYFKR